MSNNNANPTGRVIPRQSLRIDGRKIEIASSGRTLAGTMTKVLVALLLFPTLASAYPFHLTWTDINGDTDGTVVYREISGVFHEVGLVGPNVTSFTDDPPGAEGDAFCWTVRAFREGEISAPSNEICASVPTKSVTPAQSKSRPRKG